MQYTMSKDGNKRASFRVTHRVSQELCDWLIARVGKKEARKLITKLLTERGQEACWYHFVRGSDGKMMTVHADDLRHVVDQSAEVSPYMG